MLFSWIRQGYKNISIVCATNHLVGVSNRFDFHMTRYRALVYRSASHQSSSTKRRAEMTQYHHRLQMIRLGNFMTQHTTHTNKTHLFLIQICFHMSRPEHVIRLDYALVTHNTVNKSRHRNYPIRTFLAAPFFHKYTTKSNIQKHLRRRNVASFSRSSSRRFWMLVLYVVFVFLPCCSDLRGPSLIY